MAHPGYDIMAQSVREKLRTVLFQFLNVDINVNDDTCVEKLITQLSHQGDNVHLHSMCLEWMEQILQLEQPQTHLVAFAMRIVAIVVTSESGFQCLQMTDVVGRLCELMKKRNLENETSINVAYITLLTSLTKHAAGSRVIIEHALWKDVVKLCHESRSIYITRDSQNFITVVLKNLEQRPDICEEILQQVLQPLNTSNDVTLIPTLTLARYILETCLIEDNFTVPQIMLQTFKLNGQVSNWLHSAEANSGLVENVAKLAMLICFISFKQEKMDQVKNETVTAADLKELEKEVFRLFSLLICRKEFLNILKVSVYGHLTWKKIFTELRNSQQSTYFFENQLMSLQLIPVLVNMSTRAADNECLDVYCDKLFALTNEETQRVCYSFREHLLNMDNKQEMAHQAILSILQLQHIIQRDRAVVVFQALMYTLKDFVNDSHITPEAVGSDNVTRYPQLLAVVLQSLGSLIQCYSITWRESVETVCLFGYTQDLLKDVNLTPKLNVLALKLIQVAITKFMPPNLALLMDTLQGSTLNQLGPLLFRKLHDVHWEVRDSALEVLQVVASLSNVKFPAFQEHLMEHNLCSLAVRLACDDGESYVRASALKCVGQMVKVHAFWESCLSAQELPMKVISILQLESEGVVRKEAAALMREIYQHHNFPKGIIKEVYKTMAEAVTKDLYWEVEINALSFWERVIEQHMSDQGMIDGVFPNVTFSKEHRKIVTLTPHEIRSRLSKVLKELEQLGCLQVLLTALEDCDLKVVQKAASILEHLSKIMTLYGVIPQSGKSINSPNNGQTHTIKPIYDTFGFDNYRAQSIPIPVESINMECHNSASEVQEIISDNLEDNCINQRADKRKLNSESIAGSSDSNELGFSDFLMKDDSHIISMVNNSIKVAQSQPENSEANSGFITNKKPIKIFKIDNLSEHNSHPGSNKEVNDLSLYDNTININDKPNNLRGAHDLACIALEFKSDENGAFVKNVASYFGNRSQSVVNKLGDIDGSNGEPMSCPNDELYLNSFDTTHKQLNIYNKTSNPVVLTPKINNSIANAETQPVTPDQAIEDIVQQTDMNLLTMVISTQMSISDSNVNSNRSTHSSITSEEFVLRLSNLKLQDLLEERDRWLTHCGNDLDSVLDDILSFSSNNESSSLDCY